MEVYLAEASDVSFWNTDYSHVKIPEPVCSNIAVIPEKEQARELLTY